MIVGIKQVNAFFAAVVELHGVAFAGDFFKFEIGELDFCLILGFDIDNDIFCTGGDTEFGFKFECIAVVFGYPLVSAADCFVVD